MVGLKSPRPAQLELTNNFRWSNPWILSLSYTVESPWRQQSGGGGGGGLERLSLLHPYPRDSDLINWGCSLDMWILKSSPEDFNMQ